MFSPSGPVETVFLVDLKIAKVCARDILVGSDSICGFFYSVFLFCAWLCTIEVKPNWLFVSKSYCMPVFEGYCVVCYGCWFKIVQDSLPSNFVCGPSVRQDALSICQICVSVWLG